jgi:hypothetical protein
MTSDTTHPDLFSRSDPRVFSTSPDDPQSGRTFVYAKARWYERLEDDAGLGAVEFTPIADAEPELRSTLRDNGLEMDELSGDDDFAWDVRDEFLNQVPLYPEAAEDSDEPVNGDSMLTAEELGTLSSVNEDRSKRAASRSRTSTRSSRRASWETSSRGGRFRGESGGHPSRRRSRGRLRSLAALLSCCHDSGDGSHIVGIAFRRVVPTAEDGRPTFAGSPLHDSGYRFP